MKLRPTSKSCLILSAAVLLLLATGCQTGGSRQSGESPSEASTDPAATQTQQEGSAKSPVTLTTFFNVAENSSIPWNWGKDPVSQEITKRTGVTIEPVFGDNDSQKLKLMLASGEKLPDILVYVNPTTQLYKDLVDGDYVYALSDLIEKYDPGMKDMLMKGELEFNQEDDGKLYYLVSNIFGYDELKDPRLSATGQWAIREDLHKSLGSPSMKTPEELMQVLEQAKAKFPNMKYPLFLPELFLYSNPWPIYQSFGGHSTIDGKYYDEKNKTVGYWYEDEIGKKSLKYLNQLYAKGLINPEAFTLKDWSLPLNTGDVFLLGIWNYFAISGANGSLQKIDPEMSYTPVEPVIANGVDNYEVPIWYSTKSGRTAMITKDAKDPAKALEYLKFMISDEGQKLALYGLEGVTYNMEKDESGEFPVFADEVGKLFSTDFTKMVNTYGVYNYYNYAWIIKNKFDNAVMYANTKKDPLAQKTRNFYQKYKVGLKSEYLTNAIFIKPGSDEANIEIKLSDVVKKYIFQTITAKSDEQFESLYAEFMGKTQEVGIDKLKAYYATEAGKYAERLAANGVVLE